MRLVIPFGILPLCVCLANMPYAHSYANVLDAGGDGTECCQAEDIAWYLSLSPANQKRIRLGEDPDDIDSDEDSERSNSASRSYRSDSPGRIAVRRRV
mmetsp:Transcript_5639/g.4828  ORF Transcript_5639/g.4828 Transcript_5639/m.4828 type:complete len:98 (+) Transcript_5639:3-296(+)